jgi:hypothetical protein
MNKLMLMLAIAVMFMNSVSAQVYVKAGAGYGWSLGSVFIGENMTQLSPNIGSYYHEGIYGTYGKGVNVKGAIGTTVASHVMAELDVAYDAGATYHLNTNTASYTYNSTTKSRMFTIGPSLIVNTDLPWFSPYAQIGLIAAFASLKSEFIEDNGDLGPKYYGTTERSGDVALGLSGSIGLTTPVSRIFKVFGEITFVSVNWIPNQYILTRTYSGVTESRTFIFKDNFNSTDNNTSFQNPIPFGYFGLNIGIMFTL